MILSSFLCLYQAGRFFCFPVAHYIPINSPGLSSGPAAVTGMSLMCIPVSDRTIRFAVINDMPRAVVGPVMVFDRIAGMWYSDVVKSGISGEFCRIEEQLQAGLMSRSARLFVKGASLLKANASTVSLSLISRSARLLPFVRSYLPFPPAVFTGGDSDFSPISQMRSYLDSISFPGWNNCSSNHVQANRHNPGIWSCGVHIYEVSFNNPVTLFLSFPLHILVY